MRTREAAKFELTSFILIFVSIVVSEVQIAPPKAISTQTINSSIIAFSRHYVPIRAQCKTVSWYYDKFIV